MRINDNITYNPGSKRICPSDWVCFTITHFVIIPPTLIALYCLVISSNVVISVQVIIILLNVISTYGSLRNLWKAALSDPGIIPKNQGTSSGKYKINPEKSYFAKYMDREALEKIKDELGASDAERYYNLRKFEL